MILKITPIFLLSILAGCSGKDAGSNGAVGTISNAKEATIERAKEIKSTTSQDSSDSSNSSDSQGTLEASLTSTSNVTSDTNDPVILANITGVAPANEIEEIEKVEQQTNITTSATSTASTTVTNDTNLTSDTLTTEQSAVTVQEVTQEVPQEVNQTVTSDPTPESLSPTEAEIANIDKLVHIKGTIHCIHSLPDGWIIGGDLQSFNGETVGNIVKINSKGVLDKKWSTNFGDGATGIIRKIKRFKQNSIIIMGDFKEVSGIKVPQVARILANGQVDREFSRSENTPLWEGQVNDFVVRGNGDIEAIGKFSLAQQEKNESSYLFLQHSASVETEKDNVKINEKKINKKNKNKK